MTRPDRHSRRLRSIFARVHFTRAHGAALALGMALAFACTMLRVSDPYPVRLVRELAFDEFQRAAPRPYREAPVRIVDIDEASLAAVGQWPWSRSELARLLDRLHALGAASVAFDVVFAERDRLSPADWAQRPEFREAVGPELADSIAPRLPDYDRLLAAAIGRLPVVLGFGILPGRSESRPRVVAGLAFTGADPRATLPAFEAAAVNLPAFEERAAGVGAITLSPLDAQGIVRRIPLLWSDGQRVYPSLALELLRVAHGERTLTVHGRNEAPYATTAIRVGAFEVPTTGAGELRVRFGRDVPARYVSAATLLSDREDPRLRSLIEGHMVLVGTSAAGLLDTRATPLAETVPGVSIHAQALEQILAGDYLRRPDWADPFECAWVLVLAVVVTVAAVLGSPVGALLFGGAAAAVTGLGAWLAFRGDGLLVDPLFPSAAGLFVYLVLISFRYFVSDRERRFVRQAFSRYVAPSYLQQIERNPMLLRLGGEEREVTVVFLDIRNFTALSEQLSPRAVVELLNVLFDRVGKDILAEGGTIDKYIGDSIMAFWNAPISSPDHAARACRAALRIRETLERLNESDAFGLRRRPDPMPPLAVRIGLNTGPALVGNMGSEARFNYSAVGDTVNVASRVEQQAKPLSFDIVVAEPVTKAAPGFAYLEAGTLELRGKAGREKLFILVGDEAFAKSPTFAAIHAAHADLLNSLRDDALPWGERLYACFEAASEGAPLLRGFYGAVAERLADFRTAAPEDGREAQTSRTTVAAGTALG